MSPDYVAGEQQGKGVGNAVVAQSGLSELKSKRTRSFATWAPTPIP